MCPAAEQLARAALEARGAAGQQAAAAQQRAEDAVRGSRLAELRADAAEQRLAEMQQGLSGSEDMTQHIEVSMVPGTLSNVTLYCLQMLCASGCSTPVRHASLCLETWAESGLCPKDCRVRL